MRFAFCDHALPFLWLAIVNRLGDCDWFVFGNVILVRLALCGCDSLIGWLAMFTHFLSCNSNLPFFSGRTVIRLLLRDGDSLRWLDCLLNDNCFLFRLRCVHDSWFAGSFRKTIRFFRLLVDGVCCETSLAFLWLRDASCFAGDSNLLLVDLAECIGHLPGMLSFCDSASRRRGLVLSRLCFAPRFLFACPSERPSRIYDHNVSGPKAWTWEWGVEVLKYWLNVLMVMLPIWSDWSDCEEVLSDRDQLESRKPSKKL